MSDDDATIAALRADRDVVEGVAAAAIEDRDALRARLEACDAIRASYVDQVAALRAKLESSERGQRMVTNRLLERANAAEAEVERMRPVVDAVDEYFDGSGNSSKTRMFDAILAFRAAQQEATDV